jgi:hypothetical protein
MIRKMPRGLSRPYHQYLFRLHVPEYENPFDVSTLSSIRRLSAMSRIARSPFP